jgi:hypothetical protein
MRWLHGVLPIIIAVILIGCVAPSPLTDEPSTEAFLSVTDTPTATARPSDTPTWTPIPSDAPALTPTAANSPADEQTTLLPGDADSTRIAFYGTQEATRGDWFVVTMGPGGTPITPDYHDWDITAENRMMSPDGKWTAHLQYSTSPEGYIYYQYFAIEDSTGKPVFVIEDGLSVAEAGPYSYVLYQWSADSLHFYYRNLATFDACTPTERISDRIDGFGLMRVDMPSPPLDASVTTILDYNTNPVLSPDETLVAYADGFGMHIKNLINVSDDQEIDVPSYFNSDSDTLGDIVWSASESSVMLRLVRNACDPSLSSVELLRADLWNGQVAVVSAGDPRQFVIMAWPEPSRVLLRDKDNQFWYINPVTGEITPRD